MSKPDRPVLAPDDPAGAPGTVAYAGVDPTLEGRALQDALRAAIAHRRGYCWRTVDHAGWVVTLDSSDRQEFYGRTLEEALAWCLEWLMAPEIDVRSFLVWSCPPSSLGSMNQLPSVPSSIPAIWPEEGMPAS